MKSKGTLDSVRQRFERDAENFDAIYRLERSHFGRWFNRIFRKAVFLRYELTFREAGDVKDKSILDIGCGSGIYVADFARRGARRVVGIDFSSNMLALAKAEIMRQGVTHLCELRQANFLDVQFEEKFDVTIAMGVFDYLSDPVTFLRKMLAVTSGKVIITLPGHSLIREPLRKLRYLLTGKGTVFFYSDEEVQQLVKDAGLERYTLTYSTVSGGGYMLVGECAIS